ncbi:MAG TPA: DUF6457 domain-containing protein [Jatrophihabitantaceae bacterium]|nr:DUF6457 domain-containing protein [Jatrophihabitantaceae bacterium]
MTDPADSPLEAWTAELAAALGVDPEAVDVGLLLDIARDAAHGIARPAAPLTTFLVGLAAGLRGGGAAAVSEAAAIAQRLAAERVPPG